MPVSYSIIFEMPSSMSRQLLAFLRALVHQDGDGRSDLGKKEDVDNLPAILAIFRSIKNAEDLVEKDNSKVGVSCPQFLSLVLGNSNSPFFLLIRAVLSLSLEN